MGELNFKHLRYFWAVAKTGGVLRASERLHVTPQSISGQITTLEEALGLPLFRRRGRDLELTEAGRRTLSYADEIFKLGEELVQMLQDPQEIGDLVFRVGVADAVPKSIAYDLLSPSLQAAASVRLVCREGSMETLLSALSVHRLDMVIADRPMPPGANVRAFSHLLGECGLSVVAAAPLASAMTGPFPACLHRAPFLLPSAEVAVRATLLHWFDQQRVKPRIVGEFDDSALLKAFGEAGTGAFVVPSVIETSVCERYRVRVVGRIDAVREQIYGITGQRRIDHPAVALVRDTARATLFAQGNADGTSGGETQERQPAPAPM
jgi:LysR family transcriptional activator of nhaA